MDDLRIKAMDYALQARTSADDDVIALATRIHDFLRGVPPPLPDLVEQVAADAKPAQLGPESLSSAPPGMRGEMPDLSNADQSPDPFPLKAYSDRAARIGHGAEKFFEPDDDTKTRIISRA